MNKPMPSPETYIKEMECLPWKKVISLMATFIWGHFYQKGQGGGRLLDAMCGPGYLLHELVAAEERATWGKIGLSLYGLDINPEYVEHARTLVPSAAFTAADILNWNTDQPYDAVICMAGIHHIPYEDQAQLVQKLRQLVRDDGICIIAESIIPFPERDGNTYIYTETERKRAALKLGDAYTRYVINRGGTDEMIQTCFDAMSRDVLLDGRFKLNWHQLFELLNANGFEVGKTEGVWEPGRFSHETYGDYIFVAQPV